MGVTAAEIDSYFAKLDWPYTKRDESLWDSGYVGETYRVRFVVRLTERWVYINALLPVKINPECRCNMFEHLLRLSFTLNGVKLYLDGDDDVTLSIEVMAEGLTVDNFETALYAVCSNADRHFVELIRLASDPTAVSSQKPPAAGSTPPPTPPTPPTDGVDWSGGGSQQA
ncbi:MAG TPA: YbjN domain-containing protein [Chloroflexia bacterium]|nr:YbjN domain-containing protein [Chloroflexia bacterium]